MFEGIIEFTKTAASSRRGGSKLKITIKRVQNCARMALSSVSDFGKANVTMMLMATIVLLYVRARTLYI